MTKTLDGLHPTLMRPRVEAVLADPEAQRLGVTIVSAFRSTAYQSVLFARAVAKYGSAAKARKWVAPPGKSNHGPKVDGFGTAVDFGLRGVKAVSGKWPVPLREAFDALCARHGLYSPMNWEDWHFEPIPNWKPSVRRTAAPTQSSTPKSADEVARLANSTGDGVWVLHLNGAITAEGKASNLGDYTGLPPAARQGAREFGTLVRSGNGYIILSRRGEKYGPFVPK